MRTHHRKMLKELVAKGEDAGLLDMENFVHSLFEENEQEAIFEAASSFEDGGADHDVLLDMAIDEALERGLFDFARRIAASLDGPCDPAHGFMKIAEATGDAEDIRRARAAACTMDREDDLLPRAHAFLELFKLSGLESDQREVELLGQLTIEQGYPCLAFGLFAEEAETTLCLKDHLRALRCLEEADRLGDRPDGALEELLGHLIDAGNREMIDQIIASATHPRVHMDAKAFVRQRAPVPQG